MNSKQAALLPQKENVSIDARNMLAQFSTNVLWNDYKLIYDEKNQDHKEFAEALERNDLLRLFKSSEETLSKEGWDFIYWDIWDKGPMGEEYKDIELQLLPWYRVAPMWYENRFIYAAVVYRQMLFGAFAYPIYNQSILVQGEVNTIASTIPNPINEIPVLAMTIPAPKFYDRYQIGKRFPNYKDINVEPFYNKDFNFYSGGYNQVELTFMDDQKLKVPTFQHLMDAWNVINLERQINSYLSFIDKERGRNATRWVWTGGSAQQNSQQQALLSYLSAVAPQEYAQLMVAKGARDYEIALNMLAAKYKFDKDRNILKGDYIQITGDKNSVLIEKMQSTYDLKMLMSGLYELLKTYFEGSGYNWNQDITQGSYNNVASVQSHNQLTLQTVKMKKSLREKSINSLFLKIYSAWCDYNETKIEEFKKSFKFEIVCNAINDQYKNPNVILAAVQNGIKSKKQAIMDLNPTWTNEQVEEELKEIFSDISAVNELNFGAEMEFGNSVEQNNVGDNPQKSKQGAEQ